MGVFKTASKQLPYEQAYATFRSLCWMAPNVLSNEAKRLRDAVEVMLTTYKRDGSYSNWVAFEEACSKFWEVAKRG